jgi:hypothetical protein
MRSTAELRKRLCLGHLRVSEQISTCGKNGFYYITHLHISNCLPVYFTVTRTSFVASHTSAQNQCSLRLNLRLPALAVLPSSTYLSACTLSRKDPKKGCLEGAKVGCTLLGIVIFCKRGARKKKSRAARAQATGTGRGEARSLSLSLRGVQYCTVQLE